MSLRQWTSRCSWFALACLAAVLLIVICNVWLICCGHCGIGDYLRIPPVGWWILSANLLAAVVLILVKGRRKGSGVTGGGCHGCGAVLRDGWRYCPRCGGDCAPPGAPQAFK